MIRDPKGKEGMEKENDRWDESAETERVGERRNSACVSLCANLS